MFSRPSFLPSISTCAFAFALTALSARGDIAAWEFNDRAGLGLSVAENSAGDLAFDGGATGIRTTGDGFLEVRRPLGTRIVRNVALDAIESGKVWMDLKLAGWELHGEPTEELAFGFSSAPGLEEAAAVLEWKRLTPSSVWIHGVASGTGATDAAVDEFLPRVQTEPMRYVLECNLDRYTYEIYLEKAGEWESLGRGALAEGVAINYFGVRFSNLFNDVADESLLIDRLAITREDPVDRDRWQPLAEHPFVTAWSWAVADAKTGEIIAGEEVDTPRKSASVTKAMTTFVVCDLAKRDPATLEEMVHFSELALTARGSTANIEAGESLPLRDALFAFMLPSGNAVGNAIAEHFHGRLEASKGMAGKTDRDPRLDFIAEMNRVAKRLGMTQTVYRSAFGDGGTNDDRTTTARDLIKLAQASMGNELFREVVGTKEYSTEVTRADGSKRIASWTNTNQFLDEEGYNGIKTGTTRTARACLLTSTTLNGRSLYSVVLGSDHSSRRYVDSRNVLEWAAEGE